MISYSTPQLVIHPDPNTRPAAFSLDCTGATAALLSGLCCCCIPRSTVMQATWHAAPRTAPLPSHCRPLVWPVLLLLRPITRCHAVTTSNSYAATADAARAAAAPVQNSSSRCSTSTHHAPTADTAQPPAPVLHPAAFRFDSEVQQQQQQQQQQQTLHCPKPLRPYS